MTRSMALAAAAAAAFTVPALAGVQISQGPTAPTYDQTLDFDEPGGPTGVVPTDSWAGIGLAEMQAGDGVPQVDDWAILHGVPWVGTGNSFYGNFGVFMTFDGDLTEMSCNVWDPSGPPSPFGGGLGVFVFNDGVEVANFFTEPAWGGLGDPAFDITTTDGDVFDEVRVLGFGFFPTTYMDDISWNAAASGPPLDIKPGSCPNSFNRNSHGVLPVALLGTMDVDITDVDLGSLQLVRADGIGGAAVPNDGPPGPSPSYDDVATPFDGDECDCHEMGGDGFVDLMLHFRTDDVVAALELGDLPPGALVPLTLQGAMLDGTTFAATDCVRLVPPGSAPTSVAVSATLPDAWIDVQPLDCTLDGGGYGSFSRCFPVTTQVTLTAPASQSGLRFRGWAVDGVSGLVTSTELTLDLDDAATVTAVYRKTRVLRRASDNPVTSVGSR